MKLKEDTVSVKGTNKGPQAKTIFNSLNKADVKYFDIAHLSGKNITVEYDYQDGLTTKSQTTVLDIPEGLNEVGVRQYIVTFLTQLINQ